MDQFESIAFYFHIVVLHEVSEVDVSTDDRAEELCYLCLRVVCDECYEQFSVPCLADGSVLYLSFSYLRHDSVHDVFHVGFQRKGVMGEHVFVGMRRKEVL